MNKALRRQYEKNHEVTASRNMTTTQKKTKNPRKDRESSSLVLMQKHITVRHKEIQAHIQKPLAMKPSCSGSALPHFSTEGE